MASEQNPVRAVTKSLETHKKLIVLLHKLPFDVGADPSLDNIPFATSCLRNGGKRARSSWRGRGRETTAGRIHSCSHEGSVGLRKSKLDATRQLEALPKNEKGEENLSLGNRNKAKVSGCKMALKRAHSELPGGPQKNTKCQMRGKVGHLAASSHPIPHGGARSAALSVATRHGVPLLHKPPRESESPLTHSKARRNITAPPSCENASNCPMATRPEPASFCGDLGKKIRVHKNPKRVSKRARHAPFTDLKDAGNTTIRCAARDRTSHGPSDGSESPKCSEGDTGLTFEEGPCAYTDHEKFPATPKDKPRNPRTEGFVERRLTAFRDATLTVHDPYREDIQPADPHREDIQPADPQTTRLSSSAAEPSDVNMGHQITASTCTTSRALQNAPSIKDNCACDPTEIQGPPHQMNPEAPLGHLSDPGPGSCLPSGPGSCLPSGPGSCLPSGRRICDFGRPKDCSARDLTGSHTLGTGKSSAPELGSEKDIHAGTERHTDSSRSRPIHLRTTTPSERFSVHPKSLIVIVRNMEASERQAQKRVNSASSGKNLVHSPQSLRSNSCLYPRDDLRITGGEHVDGDSVCRKSEQSPPVKQDGGTDPHGSDEGGRRKGIVPYPGKRVCSCNTSDPRDKAVMKVTKCQCPGEAGFCSCELCVRGSDSPLDRARCPGGEACGRSGPPGSKTHSARSHGDVGKVCGRAHSFHGTVHQARKSPWHKKQAANVYSQVKLFKYTIGRITSKNLVFYINHKKRRAVWASQPCKTCMKTVYTKTLFRMPKPVLPSLDLQPWPVIRFTRRQGTCLPCRRAKGNPASTRAGAKEAHACTECGKRFVQPDVLHLHQRSHAEAKLLVCSVCGKRFVQETLLLIHQKTHLRRKPHQCMDCGQTFYVKELFVAHQKTHRAEKPHLCVDCGKCFADRSTLLIHRRIHTGEKPFSCADCGKSFSQHSTLVSHQRIHTGEKPFTCHECGRQFGDRSAFASHRRTHTGEKPFECEVCGKRFAQSSNLRRHERIHTGRKPYACSECGRTFNENTKLKAHLNSHLKKGT